MRYRFNMIPEGYAPRRFVDLGTFFLIIVLALYISGLTGLGILYEKRYVNLVNSLAQLNYQKNQLLFDEQSAKKILDRITRIQEQDVRDRKILNLLNDLVDRRIMWSRTMAQVTHIVPDGTWLQSMSSTGEGTSRRMVFRGMAASNQWVARFLFFLENHPDFSEVRLEFSRLAKVGDRELYSFEVNARMSQIEGRF